MCIYIYIYTFSIIIEKATNVGYDYGMIFVTARTVISRWVNIFSKN